MGARKSTRRMVRPPALPGGAQVCAAISAQIPATTRYALGIEVLSEIACELLRRESLESVSDLEMVQRFFGATYSVWYPEGPASQYQGIVASHGGMKESTLLWRALARIKEFSDDLSERDSESRWHRLRDTIAAWEDAWGEGGKARAARSLFARLTGSNPKGDLRDGGDLITYLHQSMAAALEQL